MSRKSQRPAPFLERKKYNVPLFFSFFFYSYVHKMFGSFVSPLLHPHPYTPPPSLSPPALSLPGRNYFALISNFVEETV
jgi:hypothetical protein